jgi:hypothetical protein
MNQKLGLGEICWVDDESVLDWGWIRPINAEFLFALGKSRRVVETSTSPKVYLVYESVKDIFSTTLEKI